MEARLTDILKDPQVQITPGTRDALPGVVLPGTPKAVEEETQAMQSPVALRIDRYLEAAGAGDRAWRGPITAAVARDLLAHGASGEPGWAEIIAAVDRCLAAEFAAPGGGNTPPRTSARGRVALFLAGHASAGGAAAQMERDWGAPPRQPQAMSAQDLTPWRPSWRRFAEWSIGRLQRLRVSRSAQGLAACLTWLAVIIIP